jgi:hypothetical protein
VCVLGLCVLVNYVAFRVTYGSNGPVSEKIVDVTLTFPESTPGFHVWKTMEADIRGKVKEALRRGVKTFNIKIEGVK